MPAAFSSTKFQADPFFAETVNYAGIAGIKAVINEGPDPASGGSLERATGRWAVAWLWVSEVSEPVYGQKLIQSGGETWTTQSVAREGDMWKITLVMDLRAQKPRQY